jgi:hypothetical protein
MARLRTLLLSYDGHDLWVPQCSPEDGVANYSQYPVYSPQVNRCGKNLSIGCDTSDLFGRHGYVRPTALRKGEQLTPQESAHWLVVDVEMSAGR